MLVYILHDIHVSSVYVNISHDLGLLVTYTNMNTLWYISVSYNVPLHMSTVFV